MNFRRNCLIIVCVLAMCISSAYADSKLKVVSTLSVYADLVEQIGGEFVKVSYIAPPRFNPHFIEPRPTDVLKVKKADLFVHSGLDLELWRGPLLVAAGNAEVMPGGANELNMSNGIVLLEVPQGASSRSEGDIHLYGNPHFQLCPVNGKQMATAIYDKLSALDPKHKDYYHLNYKSFVDSLDKKIEEWQKLMQPHKEQELVGYHKEWIYLMNFAGLKMGHFLEPKPGIPPTPRHVDKIVKLIESKGIKAIVQASFFPKMTAEAIAKQTGAKALVLCHNVGELEECSDYISTLDYNINQLAQALG